MATTKPLPDLAPSPVSSLLYPHFLALWPNQTPWSGYKEAVFFTPVTLQLPFPLPFLPTPVSL